MAGFKQAGSGTPFLLPPITPHQPPHRPQAAVLRYPLPVRERGCLFLPMQCSVSDDSASDTVAFSQRGMAQSCPRPGLSTRLPADRSRSASPHAVQPEPHRGARDRLPPRLDPLRRADHPLCRRGRPPRHRLRQYRRDQRAPHRPSRSCRGDAGRRLPQGHGGGARRLGAVRTRRRDDRRPRRLPRPCLPGLAQVQGRQGRRHLSRRPHRPRPSQPCLAGGVRLRRRLARHGLLHPLLLARARWSPPCVTPLVLIFVFHDRTGGLFVVLTAILWWRHADNIRRLLAGTESRIGARNDRGPSRAGNPPQRRAAPRLAPPDPEREHRPGHLPRTDQPLRQRHRGAGRRTRARQARRPLHPHLSRRPKPSANSPPSRGSADGWWRWANRTIRRLSAISPTPRRSSP